MTSNGNGRQGLALNNRGRVLSPAAWLIAFVMLGVLTAACSADPTATPIPTATPMPVPTPTTAPPEVEPALTTHLYALESESVSLESFDGSGGAMETLGDDLLVVTPKGRFALVARDGTVEYLAGSVPMNYTGLKAHEDYANPTFNPERFRVADILLKELGDGRYGLFATHHYFTGECIRFRLSSTTIRRDAAGITVSPDWRRIFDAEPCLPLLDFGGHQAGGKMLTDGADHLLVIIGDHIMDDWQARPTFDPGVHLGKLLRIAIETGEVEVLAIGLRNSQGLARDGAGNLWAPDHGPRGGDELNLLEPGGNYGWPQVSYGITNESTVPPDIEDGKAGRHDGFRRPALAWVPSPAVSAIAVNDERRFPLWKDDLLVASLKAQSLFRVRRHGTDVQYFERIEVGYRVRDLTFLPDGRIALLQDGGWVTFLSRSPRYCDAEARERRDIYAVNCESASALPWLDLPGAGISGIDTASGAQLFGAQCSVCHNLNAERHGLGPHLVGVIGRPAGEVADYRFSPAFDSLGVVWTRDRLTQFLTDPAQFAPGTTMASTGATEGEARAIAGYLDSLNHLSRLVRDRQPAIRSDFDVYLVENNLIYTKEDCSDADVAPKFFLALYPVDVNDLPDQRRQHGFDNLDFDFYWFGGVFGGRCTATVALPEYAIARIVTGQFVNVDGGGFKHLWEGEFSGKASR